MAFRVLLDANAIFGALQRSILVRVGEQQAAFNLRMLVTEEILAEMVRTVREKYPDLTAEWAESLTDAINDAIPDCIVDGYEHLIESAEIADADDRHVVAAAMHAGAQLIITSDMAFADAAIHPIETQNPDDFLTDLYDLDERTMRQIVAEEASQRGITIDLLSDELERRGLIRFAQHLRR